MRRIKFSETEMQTDHLTPAKCPYLVLINKKKITYLSVPPKHRIKLKEDKKLDKYLDLAKELKKAVEHKGDAYTNCTWALGIIPKNLEKKLDTRERIEKIETIALLKSTKILWSVL